MDHHHSGDICPDIKTAIETTIEGSSATVNGGGGHYSITVVSSEFSGKSMLVQQRMVYSAITALMSGDNAPLHAVDSLVTRTP